METKLKTKSSALRAYCRAARTRLARPKYEKCGGQLEKCFSGPSLWICHDCVLRHGIGSQKLKLIDYSDSNIREDERRVALLQIPEAIRKTKRKKFTVEGCEGVFALRGTSDATTNSGAILEIALTDRNLIVAAVPWGKDNWRAKVLRRI